MQIALALVLILANGSGEEPALARAIAAFESFDHGLATKILRERLAGESLPPTEEAKLRVFLGVVQFTAGKRDAAMEQFRRALALDPAVTLPARTSPKIVARFAALPRGGSSVTKPGDPGPAGGGDPAGHGHAGDAGHDHAGDGDHAGHDHAGHADHAGSGSHADHGDRTGHSDDADPGGERTDTQPGADPGLATDPLVDPAAVVPARPRTLTWIAGGTGVAVFGVAAVFGVLAENARGGSRVEPWADLAAGLGREAQGHAVVANTMFAVGTALIASSVLLFFLEGSPDPPTRPLAVGP